MKPIISVEGLGKSYTIRHEGQTHYRSLREEIFKLPARLLKKSAACREEFWALRDVSFDIMPGERVGIIGRNGAGKSTLLKLLSRITVPTTGRITLRGRVASLLEVGTGFHPELTGRENIFLNGAILGMSRAEVRRKFDEIVDFAGVEKFLDTPVKRYSSGMYVRLAFAVAAHLEPEILIVDEVLAVGDAEFQKKCLGKMEEVGREGRTVLFVSHNMHAVSMLCDRGLFLSAGKIVCQSGEINACINFYSQKGLGESNIWINEKMLFKNKPIQPLIMKVTNEKGDVVRSINFSENIFLHVVFNLEAKISNIDIYYKLYNDAGICVHVGDVFRFSDYEQISRGTWRISIKMPVMNLAPGNYHVFLLSSIINVEWIFNQENGPEISFEIRKDPTHMDYWQVERKCILAAPDMKWHIERAGDCETQLVLK